RPVRGRGLGGGRECGPSGRRWARTQRPTQLLEPTEEREFAGKSLQTRLALTDRRRRSSYETVGVGPELSKETDDGDGNAAGFVTALSPCRATRDHVGPTH